MTEKISVAIADDEPLVCVVIQKCIHWNELGMELTGIAHDGKALLDLVQETHPDIVITDINMPELDGLEFIETCRREGAVSRFIIITGYKQFDYIYKALKNNVDDYLLKPISEVEINHTLEKLRNDILDEKSHGKAVVESLQDNLKKDREQMKNMFLTHMLESDGRMLADEATIRERYGLVFSERSLFRAIIVKIDIHQNEEIEDGFLSIQNKLVSIYKEVFEENIEHCFLSEENGRLLLGLCYGEEYKRNFFEKCHRYYEKCRMTVELFSGFDLTLCISGEKKELKDFYSAFEEARSAMYYRLRSGVNKIIVYDQMEKTEPYFTEDERTRFLAEIQKDMDVLDTAGYERHIEKLFFDIGIQYNPAELIRICDDITNGWFKTLEQMNPEAKGSQLQYLHDMILKRIDNAVNRKALKNAILEPIKESIEKQNEEKSNRKKQPVRLAIRYIEEHYCENLTLDIVAEQVSLNPVYLSNVFKKETGDNFTDYIHKCRMDMAKQKLRSSSDSIVKIALDLGYSDAKYFSKMFRKYEKIKPTDYRKIYGA